MHLLFIIMLIFAVVLLVLVVIGPETGRQKWINIVLLIFNIILLVERIGWLGLK